MFPLEVIIEKDKMKDAVDLRNACWKHTTRKNDKSLVVLRLLNAKMSCIISSKSP